MNNLAEILEEELEEAVEVKNKKSLHRYITLLTQNLAERQAVDRQLVEINNKIEILTRTMKVGFENMEKRFTDLIHYIDKRFEDMQKYMNKRFEDMQKYMDRRFEDMHKYMDKRFEDMNKRFVDMNKKINLLIWIISLWMGLFSGISLVLKFIK